ncbi:hypothetical protein HYALB_00012069 [Hymenoscyphus albidus]|uniref:Uncharacterized protein n=1 Tax=Hymenoscyphus albidus TaxID=595503 RepID=A0A9N9LP23_9HELO|nr:hypothetical protein HYALB_00012069 [Hymenoscyphus albidus]
MSQDSALSIAASITGILTFVGAVIADQIELLHKETSMLNNAYLASQIRHPDRKYGTGDFQYFQRLYKESLDKLSEMDRKLEESAVSVTGGNDMRYNKVSRVNSAALWMAAREKIRRSIKQRKAESNRTFQIQLAMLSAKIDGLSYHQNHHNSTCNVIEEVGSLRSGVQSNIFRIKSSDSTDPTPREYQKVATNSDKEPLITEILKISSGPLLNGGAGYTFDVHSGAT